MDHTDEQRSSAFTRFAAYPPPPAQPQGPTSLLYPSFPSFCPRCQFDTSYCVNGICMNCNLPLATSPRLLPGIPVRSRQPATPQANSSMIPPLPHQMTPGGTSLFPPSLVGSLGLPLGGGRGSQDHQERSTVDPFMMSSILDSVNDVLKDTYETSDRAGLICPKGMFGIGGGGGGGGGGGDAAITAPPTAAPNVLTIPLGSDGFVSSSRPHHGFVRSPAPSPPPLYADAGPGGGGGSGRGGGVSGGLMLPQPSSLEVKSSCHCGSNHIMFRLNGHRSCSDCSAIPNNPTPSSSSPPSSNTTTNHQLIGLPPASLPGSRRTTPPGSLTPYEPLPPPLEEDELDSCEKHPDERLIFFCPPCATLVCKICLGVDHAHHNILSVHEALHRYRPNLKELLSKSQVELDLLEYSLTETKKMGSRVAEKQQEAVSEVRRIFQAHREEVGKREQEVIAQINNVASIRSGSLANDEEKIGKFLDSVRSLSQAGEQGLKEGASRSKALVTHFKLNGQLKGCRAYTSSQTPSEDDSFLVKSNPLSAQSALKDLCLFTTAPYPPLCTAMGEGLYYPRVNKMCSVILATKDRAGEPCLEGGERLFVQLKPTSNGSNGPIPIDFRDHSDGSYAINFRPQVKGEHHLTVAIRGQHIQGSPFTLFVDGGREYGRFGMLTHVFGSEGSGNGQFCRPWGICCDQHGNIVVGDRSNHRIQVFDSNGNFKHKFGSEGVRPGQFNRPAGVAITREGHVVVADKDNHRIQVLKMDGTFLFMFGSKGGNDGQMIYPYDVAVNQVDGRIATTDTGNHRLLIFSNDGILLGKFGYKGYLCGHFDSPRGIAFNDEGNIIVSDFNVHHILLIHTEGTTARILGSQGSGNGQFMRPQGIAVDHMSNFVVADTRNNRIAIMHPSGHFVAKFGTAGTAPGQFDRPTSVAILPDGRVAVVDFGNSRVQIFNNCKGDPNTTTSS